MWAQLFMQLQFPIYICRGKNYWTFFWDANKQFELNCEKFPITVWIYYLYVQIFACTWWWFDFKQEMGEKWKEGYSNLSYGSFFYYSNGFFFFFYFFSNLHNIRNHHGLDRIDCVNSDFDFDLFVDHFLQTLDVFDVVCSVYVLL